ncbi:MAG: hypothetical protein UHG91_01030 [Succinivibrionaceae bacterium]|nr:hypothetical protein [Succinivibrionaceae bacterium]
MFSLKKAIYYLTGVLILAIVILGIKIIVSDGLAISDLYILLTEVLVYIFTIASLINYRIKDTLKYKPVWLVGVFFSVISALFWVYIINVSPSAPLGIDLFPIAMITSVLSFTVTNFGIVNLAQKSSLFAPIFIVLTKILCALAAIYLIVIILGWYVDSVLTIKSFLVVFLVLSYCNFMIILLHYLGIRKRNNSLVLTQTKTNGVYIDKVGTQYLVKKISLEENLAQNKEVETNTNTNLESK